MSKVQLKAESLIAHCECQSNGELSLSRLTYPDIYIPNRGLAWTLSTKDDDDDMVVKIKKDIDEYNSYIEKVLSIDGFWEYFKTSGYYISEEDCKRILGEEQADIIFALSNYQFGTSICKNGKWLFMYGAKWKYSVSIGDCKIEFETEETDRGYPKSVKMGRRKYDVLWNWSEDERDFCFYLWDKAYWKDWIIPPEDDVEPIKSYPHFECYEQGRDCMDEPDSNLMKIFKLLQDTGYLWVYYIKPECENPIWQLRAAPDGKIGMMLLDTTFEKNSLIMEKIKLRLNCAEADVDDYMLTDESGHQFQSKVKGEFGGHNKLKIYGRMNCPSANRYVQAGKYVQHRVFFADEETAIKAGYRPCAKCMPEEYKMWKKGVLQSE